MLGPRRALLAGRTTFAGHSSGHSYLRPASGSAELYTAHCSRSSGHLLKKDDTPAPRHRSARRGPRTRLGPARRGGVAPPAPLAHGPAHGRRAAADAPPGAWHTRRRAPGARLPDNNSTIRPEETLAGDRAGRVPARAHRKEGPRAARAGAPGEVLVRGVRPGVFSGSMVFLAASYANSAPNTFLPTTT